MKKIFISYARADDEPFVKQLYQDLTEGGFDIWWDRKAMDSRGLTFLQEIRDAIEGSDRLIAVIGPNAVKSEYVKVEWEHGLLFAKGILPILRMGDFDLIPQELSKFHCPDFRKERTYKDSLDELVRILSEPVPPLGPFNTSVPSLPPHFQSRRDEIIHIGEMVLADIQRPTVVTSAKQTTAIVGMGGSGKSVLAAAFARATDTRRAFTDGIFWLQIGQNPDILSSMRLIGRGFNDDPGNYVDIERAKASLPKVLGDKVCLIVLDDIWNASHAAPFINALGARCRLLITTRDGSLVTALGAQEHLLGMLTDTGAMRFLADWCDASSLPPEAATVAKECGYLPFALALCGAMARDGIPWPDMMEALNEADLAFIEKQFPNYPYTNVLKSLKISIDALAGEDPEAVKHYQELVVFHNHRSIPEAAIMTLWMHTDGFKERSARKLLAALNSKALLRLEGEARNRSVTLHDLQHDYLRATAGDLKNLHEKLLAAYQKKCKDGWASGPNDGYYFENLGYHLVEAGRKEELRRLLFDFGWINTKLEAADVNSLIKDYDFLLDERDLRLVQGALLLSAHVLAQDKMQLRSQLYGRLMRQEAPEIKVMLEQIRQKKDGLWLRPLALSLTPPGGPLISTLVGHTGSVTDVVALTDGKQAISASFDKTLRVWDLSSGEEVHALKGHKKGVNAVAVTPDGKLAISASDDNTLKIWDLRSGEEVHTLKGHKKRVNAVAVTPDGKLAISASDDRTLRIWDLESKVIKFVLKGHKDGVTAVDVTLDGKHAISASEDETLKIWDIKSGKLLQIRDRYYGSSTFEVVVDGERVLHLTKSDYQSLVDIWAVTPDGKLSIFPAVGETYMYVYDMIKKEYLYTLKGHEKGVNSIAVTPDGQRAISASNDNTLKIWNLKIEKAEFVPESHNGRVSSLAITQDGRHAISGSWDGTLKTWDLDNGNLLHTLEEHKGGITAVIVNSDGKRVISASGDKTLKIWDLENGRLLGTLVGHGDAVLDVTVTSDEKQAISASYDKTLIIWDLERGIALHTLKDIDVVEMVVMIQDGEQVISTSGDTLKIWDLKSKRVLHTLKIHTNGIFSVAVTRDGKRAVSASSDSTLQIWDVKSGKKMRTLEGHTRGIYSMVVTQDGKFAISGSGDQTLRIWNLESGEALQILKGHTDTILAVAVTRDGKFVISGSADKTLRIWNFARMKEIACFNGETSIWTCAVSPDSRTIIAGEESGSVHILRLEDAE